MKLDSPADLVPGLYLVATPIGNLRDMTLRALDVLGAVDAVACEDTRVTGRLLQAHGLKKSMILYNDHTTAQRRDEIVARIARGERIALVGDAGTPLISDPGFKLVRACAAAGLYVTALPGPSAALAALQLAALPTDCFAFLGFPPPRSGGRRKVFLRWAEIQATLIVFETAPRLVASLRDMAATFGGTRPATLVREMTKRFEEVRRGTLEALADHYGREGPPKGEIVVVLGPPSEDSARDVCGLDEKLRVALDTMSVREAAASLMQETGLSRRELYEKALAIAKRRDESWRP